MMATWPLLPACVCNAFSVMQFSSVAPNNCLALEGKKVFNYTHPYRDVIDFATQYVRYLRRTSASM